MKHCPIVTQFDVRALVVETHTHTHTHTHRKKKKKLFFDMATRESPKARASDLAASPDSPHDSPQIGRAHV